MKNLNHTARPLLKLFAVIGGIICLQSSAFAFSPSHESGYDDGDGGGGSIVSDAEQIRDDGLKIIAAAFQKTGDQKFNRMEQKLRNARFEVGESGECKDANAYANPGGSTIYFCRSPAMHTLIHESVHLTEGGWGGGGLSNECAADYYMIKAIFYGTGEVEQGAYDEDCPDNVSLQQSLASGGAQ